MHREAATLSSDSVVCDQHLTGSHVCHINFDELPSRHATLTMCDFDTNVLPECLVLANPTLPFPQADSLDDEAA